MSYESLLYIEIDVLVGMYIAIMAINLWNTKESSNSDKAFFMGIVSIGIILVTDIIATAGEGIPGRLMHAILYLDNVVYFAFTGIAAYACLLYIDYVITDNTRVVDERRIMYVVPSVVLTVLSIVSLRFNSIFYIDRLNYYHRGNLHVVQQIITTLYFIVAICYSVASFFKAKNDAKKMVCSKMIIFTAVPLVGLVLQILLPGTAIIWPFASVGMFIVFSSLQNSQISMDSLTGLNNRGRLMKYLKDRCDKVEDGWVLSCTMFDIDNFKSINDRYGHYVGDSAIKQVADVIKKTVGALDGSHFIARYTGNSFAVISYDERNHTDELEQAFQRNLEGFNDSNEANYSLNVSVGSADYTKFEMTPDDLLKNADDAMYKNKAKLKSLKQKRNVEDLVN